MNPKPQNNHIYNAASNNLNSSNSQTEDADINPNPSELQQTPQPQQNERTLQYMGGYSMMQPNESRRSKLQRMAQQEEEDLQRWKEEHRAGPVNLAPERLGGALSMEQARINQFMNQRQSKYQLKLKREEQAKKQKEAEEEELKKMKTVQREKANRLEEKTLKEEEQRRELHSHDHKIKTNAFIQTLEAVNLSSDTKNNPPEISSWARGKAYRESQREDESRKYLQMKEEQRIKAELLELKQRQEEDKRRGELNNERRQVNAAFLDRLQGIRQPCIMEQPLPVVFKDETNFCVAGPQDAPGISENRQLKNEIEGGEEYETDNAWVVMKLLTDFPFCERAFLEEIVTQCNGDYQQAFQLLS
ncbi:epithelial-stromal interaction protein 1 [Erpetoichthys calabaricus]|uniref:epithelial-stromal interaction protein 1 n=1 Tax=Erpetoichthys calabaricus TaxID=27687 RepID=UPI0022347E9E|nr:epithelial-stromal interaction protein 1 [Erpetoichthys calabaricus]